ncbi:hypothetical protein R1flu_023480 [Riccia fluitans]|uniref:Uncharacterized protein n=1 Tax=Riccia fluitans TaxID=41844 RepID=A0ABD1XW72_9MARC
MYLASFKKAREWSMSIGVGLIEDEVTRGMTIEDKLNQKCPFYHRMYAIFGHRANIVPPATIEDGLPPEVEVEEDSSVPITFLDSQVTTEIFEQQFELPIENQFVFQTTGNEGGSNVEVDENAHAEKGGLNVEGDEIAHANFDEEFGDDGGALDDEMGWRPEEELEFPESGTRFGAQPFVHVQPSSMERPCRGTSSSQHTNEEVSNETPTAKREGKRPTQRSNLISVYEDAVWEKTLRRKQIMESKEIFREQMLIERKMARVQKEQFLVKQVKESQKRTRIDRCLLVYSWN